jgi:hypothetical protein
VPRLFAISATHLLRRLRSGSNDSFRHKRVRGATWPSTRRRACDPRKPVLSGVSTMVAQAGQVRLPQCGETSNGSRPRGLAEKKGWLRGSRRPGDRSSPPCARAHREDPALRARGSGQGGAVGTVAGRRHARCARRESNAFLPSTPPLTSCRGCPTLGHGRVIRDLRSRSWPIRARTERTPRTPSTSSSPASPATVSPSDLRATAGSSAWVTSNTS